MSEVCVGMRHRLKLGRFVTVACETSKSAPLNLCRVRVSKKACDQLDLAAAPAVKRESHQRVPLFSFCEGNFCGTVPALRGVGHEKEITWTNQTKVALAIARAFESRP